MVEGTRSLNTKTSPTGLAIPANKWRSDTLQTLIRTPTFQKRREKALRDLGSELNQNLSRFLIGVDHASLSEHLTDLENLVLQPAAQLHQSMRCSRYEYDIKVPAVVPGQPLRKKARSEWELMDISTWLPMGAGDEVLGVFACLHPTILRRGIMDGEADVEVVKPVVLAYDKSAPKPPQRLSRVVSRGSGLGQPLRIS